MRRLSAVALELPSQVGPPTSEAAAAPLEGQRLFDAPRAPAPWRLPSPVATDFLRRLRGAFDSPPLLRPIAAEVLRRASPAADRVYLVSAAGDSRTRPGLSACASGAPRHELCSV